MYNLTDEEVENIVLGRFTDQQVKDLRVKCKHSVLELHELIKSSEGTVKAKYKEMLSKYLYKLQVVFNFKSSYYVPVQG